MITQIMLNLQDEFQAGLVGLQCTSTILFRRFVSNRYQRGDLRVHRAKR